jgi:hypothetical protein
LVEALLIQSDSECPSPLAVEAEVRDLTTPEQRAGAPKDARVVISDRGPAIAIAISKDGKTVIRVYQDAARDCARRAHFVSVLAVVSLLPPDVQTDADTETQTDADTVSNREAPSRAVIKAVPPAPPTVVEPPPPPPPPPPLRLVRLELGGVVSFSIPVGDTVRAISPGALLGVALGSGPLRLTLATEYAPAVDVDFTGTSAGRAELERFDVAVGARVVLSHTAVDSSFELGALASRAELSGLTPQRPSQDTAFSLGARAGFHLGFGERRLLGPFVSAHAKLFPVAPTLSQLPQGTVGHLPYLWLGLSAGLALAL